jgi:hypothetical protein
MAVHHRRAGGTKWLINAEAGVLSCNAWATRKRALHFLRRLLIEIWAHESPAGKSMPELVFGHGMWYRDGFVSFCQGHSKLELAPGQRNALILIHETAHALGYPWHNDGFIRRYLGLLRKYGRYDAAVVNELAESRGLKLETK